MKKYKTVVIIGKFMPLHKGHEYLIRFGKEYAENLYVIVDCLKEQTIEPELRKKWIEETIPNINVIALKQNMPQQPEDHPDFWNLWKDTIISEIIKAGGEKPDALVASMDYGYKLSEVLECDFVPNDVNGESIPISATQIRNDVFSMWEFLAPASRSYYMKKLCFVGPESSGKTTCAKRIAKDLSTVYVPEHAKSLIEKQNGQFFLHNVEQVAMTQVNSEKALSQFVNKVMICDSDPLTTYLWSQVLFNQCPQSVVDLMQAQKYDMTFLFDENTPFTEDIHRNLTCKGINELQKERHDFFEQAKQKLEELKRPYVVISGDYEQRYEQVKNWIAKEYDLFPRTNKLKL